VLPTIEVESSVSLADPLFILTSTLSRKVYIFRVVQREDLQGGPKGKRSLETQVELMQLAVGGAIPTLFPFGIVSIVIPARSSWMKAVMLLECRVEQDRT